MIPAMTILMIVIIVARYFFGIGLTGLQELVMYIHALVFLGCVGYVHYKDEHVRVDIFYRESSIKYKKKVNFILSLLFLIPLCFVIGYFSIELINMAWKIKEVSTEAGGLGYVYLQKTLIILFPITLLLTIIHQFIKNKWN
jgi:TRAP-type mannitol/chloroaromatic compound transport system permease small subunit